MLEVRAPWWARIPMLGNLGAPIIRKEVFSLVRRNRWFWAQFIYLLVLAGGMAIVYASNSGFRLPPEVLGGKLVGGFFALQLGLVFLIFPGLAATSFSLERAEKSFDLLVVSDLSPAELVWGKLLGILGSAFYFLVSTLPILAVCIFFGGLSPISIIVDYAFLFAMAIVVTSWGILISSMSRSNLLAIIGTYALAIILGPMVVSLYAVGLNAMSGARGIWEALESIPPDERWFLLTAAPAAILVFISGCLIGATFFLSSPESNRGIPVRVYFTLLILFALAYEAFIIEPLNRKVMSPSVAQFGSEGIRTIWITGVALFLLLIGIAGARVETSLRAVRQAALRPMRWWCAWPLVSGGIRGWVLSSVLLAAGFFGLLGALSESAAIVEARTGSLVFGKANAMVVFAWLADIFAAWIFAYLGLAFLFSTLGLRGGINWFLTVGVAILTILLSIARINTSMLLDSDQILFSPIMQSLMRFESRFPLDGPTRDGVTTVHWILGGLFFIGGLVSLRVQGLPAIRLRRPGYEFLESPPAPAPVLEAASAPATLENPSPEADGEANRAESGAGGTP